MATDLKPAICGARHASANRRGSVIARKHSWRPTFGTAMVALVALGLVLTSCSLSPAHKSAPGIVQSHLESLRTLPVAGTYRIDAIQSELRLLVYRGGVLAQLGHNHVIMNRAIAGSILVADTLSASSFSLSMALDDFVIDDAQSRREEGEDFAGEVSQDAKSGTKHNMLIPEFLDAERYPLIIVKSVSLNSSLESPTATLRISIAGHDSIVETAFTLQGDSQSLVATGLFELRQTDIGLTPYRLLGGALQVQDTMLVKLKLVAAIS